MAFGDKILNQARRHSIQLEKLAAVELCDRLNEYLPPSYGARKMAEAYSRYADNGINTVDEYYQFRQTFTETKGVSNQVFSKVLASHIKPEPYSKSTMFDVEDRDGTIRGAVRSLQRDGLWIAKFKVPDNLIESLKAKSLERFVAREGDAIDRMFAGDKTAPAQVKSNYSWVTTFDEMYRISSDPLLTTIVHQYLGVPPIFDTPVVFLNSAAPLDEKGLSDHAQLYHHDLHRLQFVKLFIYLTDVDAGSGPHAMIKGSHRSRPDAMWADGRHTDAAVTASGLMANETRITGKAGTVFLVDTSALHKGVHPDNNARLLAQVQYTNSLFGKPLPSISRIYQEARVRKDDADLAAATALVKKYAEFAGVRFMQALI